MGHFHSRWPCFLPPPRLHTLPGPVGCSKLSLSPSLLSKERGVFTRVIIQGNGVMSPFCGKVSQRTAGLTLQWSRVDKGRSELVPKKLVVGVNRRLWART